MVSTSSSSFRKSSTSCTVLGESVSKKVVLVATAEALFLGRLYGGDSLFENTFPADGLVVALFQAIDVDNPRKGGMGLEPVELAFQQQGVGAQVDEALALEQGLGHFLDLGVQQRLAPGDRHHGGPALLDGGHGLFDREALA